MGLAASQARYLDLTSRKSNVEFQGQMVNQQRTELANESAGIFAEMLTIDPPVAPNQSEYQNTAYMFDGLNSDSTDKYKLIERTAIESEVEGEDSLYEVRIMYNSGKGTVSNPVYEYARGKAKLTFDPDKTDLVTSIQMTEFYEGEATQSVKADIGTAIHETSVSSYINEERYAEAMNQYEYDYAQYQKKMNELQARTQKIQVQDRTLELQLRQLDTEQEALQTEMESVKKVIEKSVDQIFKTFQS